MFKNNSDESKDSYEHGDVKDSDDIKNSDDIMDRNNNKDNNESIHFKCSSDSHCIIRHSNSDSKDSDNQKRKADEIGENEDFAYDREITLALWHFLGTKEWDSLSNDELKELLLKCSNTVWGYSNDYK